MSGAPRVADGAVVGGVPFNVGGVPRVHESAFIAPSAVVIGNVSIGAEASVWFGCVLRGDQGSIVVGTTANIQDGSVVHGTVEVGAETTVGHRTVLHGCRIAERVLIGMGAIVLDGAQIGEGSIVAAGAVVSPGTEVPAGVLVAGVPAVVRRRITKEDRRRIEIGALSYAHLARVYRRVEPLDPSVWAEFD